jgi:hypothetical protein
VGLSRVGGGEEMYAYIQGTSHSPPSVITVIHTQDRDHNHKHIALVFLFS